MANATTVQILRDGPKNVVMQFTGINDGSDPEVNVVKVAVADLNPRPLTLKVMRTTYDVQGGMLRMSWDADDPVPFLLATGVLTVDYKSVKGITNAGVNNVTGNILFSMLGFEAGSSYSVKLEMVKKYA